MAVIAIYSVKGGVGKTSIATNLAWCAATDSARRSLLWDLDPAGGAGYLLGIHHNGNRTADAALTKRPEQLICTTAWPGLAVLPADESIRALDRQFMQIGNRNRLTRITRTLGSQYERLVLDCPPVVNEISAQVVRSADLVIVPLPPSPLSSRALEIVVEQVKTHTRKPHPPILPVLSMVDLRRGFHRQVVANDIEWPVVPQASAIEQCAVRQMPVGAFAPNSAAAQSLSRLWQAIEQKLVKMGR